MLNPYEEYERDGVPSAKVEGECCICGNEFYKGDKPYEMPVDYGKRKEVVCNNTDCLYKWYIENDDAREKIADMARECGDLVYV